MRRAVTPAIPPSIYRHFAIVTVVLTAGMAMFADGENREAQAAQIALSEPGRPAAPISLATASPTTVRRQRIDVWDDYDAAPVGSRSGIDPDPDDVAATEYSSEQVASLSQAERGLLLRGLRERGAPLGDD